MVSYQGMQSGVPVYFVGEFGTFDILMQNDCLVKPDFSLKNKTTNIKKIDIWTEYDHILLFTDQKSILLQF